MPKLVLVQGNCDSDEVQLVDRLTIGRGLGNDLKILDHNVSRHHALIEQRSGQYYIRDLASTNGTLVNGLLIQEKTLMEGDQIQIGKTIFLFEKNSTRIFFPTQKNSLIQLIEESTPLRMDIAMEVETHQIRVPDYLLDFKQPHNLISAFRKVSILFEIAKTLGSGSQLVPMLSKILQSVFKVIRVDSGAVLLKDPYNQEFVPLIVKTREDRPGRAGKIAISTQILEHVQKTRKGILTSETMTLEQCGTPQPLTMTVICVPFFVREQPSGMLWFESEHKISTFSQDDLELISAIGQQIALAIENVHLTQERIKSERLRTIGEMMSSIVHEIKNPLASIQVYTELLQKPTRTEDHRDYCRIILGEISRLLEITNQILDYGQHIHLRLEEVDITALIDEVLIILGPQIAQKRLIVRKRFKPPEQPLTADRDKLKQVIFNILLNAIQLTPPEGNIDIRTSFSTHRTFYRISIADSGPGISPELRDQVFQPFFSNRQGGTGLGLSLSQRIMEEHQGRISCESEEGRGATFHVEIPIDRSEASLPLVDRIINSRF